jgi:hypothetical protein
MVSVRPHYSGLGAATCRNRRQSPALLIRRANLEESADANRARIVEAVCGSKPLCY